MTQTPRCLSFKPWIISNTSSFSKSVIKSPSSNHHHYPLEHKDPPVIQITHPPPNLLTPHPIPHITITPHAPLTQTTTTSLTITQSTFSLHYIPTPKRSKPVHQTWHSPFAHYLSWKACNYIVLTHRFNQIQKTPKKKSKIPPFLPPLLPVPTYLHASPFLQRKNRSKVELRQVGYVCCDVLHRSFVGLWE